MLATKSFRFKVTAFKDSNFLYEREAYLIVLPLLFKLRNLHFENKSRTVKEVIKLQFI
jgi:hypothetical protein